MATERRILFWGTGTGVGKSWCAAHLTRSLVQAGERALALKPIESGIPAGLLEGTDAGTLGAASGIPVAPRYALRAPISPHLAARDEGERIELAAVKQWVLEQERAHPTTTTIVETAGGVFSPLSERETNLELGQILAELPGPSWLRVLVAPDSLGVLHDVTATLLALHQAGARPDLLVLSGAREPDASTGTNRRELETVVFPRLGAAAPREREVLAVGRQETASSAWARVLGVG